MLKWLGCLGVLVLAVLILGGIALGTYNSLVGLGQGVDAQWAQVENQYQRRADLIPNLVKTVAGRGELREVDARGRWSKARASVGGQVNLGNLPNDPAAMARFQQAQDALSGALSRLMVVVERYPELKANAELPRPAGRSSRARRTASPSSAAATTRSAQAYNTARLRFPAVLFANLLGMREKTYFQARPGSDAGAERQLQLRRHARAGRALGRGRRSCAPSCARSSCAPSCLGGRAAGAAAEEPLPPPPTALLQRLRRARVRRATRSGSTRSSGRSRSRPRPRSWSRSSPSCPRPRSRTSRPHRAVVAGGRGRSSTTARSSSSSCATARCGSRRATASRARCPTRSPAASSTSRCVPHFRSGRLGGRHRGRDRRDHRRHAGRVQGPPAEEGARPLVPRRRPRRPRSCCSSSGSPSQGSRHVYGGRTYDGRGWRRGGGRVAGRRLGRRRRVGGGGGGGGWGGGGGGFSGGGGSFGGGGASSSW